MITFPFIIPVKGVSFFQNKVNTIKPGDSCRITPEPFNEFDSNACAVFVNNNKIGYVPKALAPRFSDLGSDLVGVVAEIVGPEGQKGVRVKMQELAHNSDSAPENSKDTDQFVKDSDSYSKEVKIFSKSGRFIGFLIKRRDAETLFIEDAEGDRFDFPASLASVKE
jgi:hypothetical protein